MSTVQAFNTMLKNFLDELADVFPEELQIKLAVETFDTVTSVSPRGPMDMFIESLSPLSALVMAKDPALFEQLQFPGGIDFAKLWKADISDNTRDAIWQYINLLFLLGTTVRSMPPQMLESIESVAKNCADQIQSGQMDFTGLSTMLMNSGLGAGMPGLGGLGDLGNLMGSDDTPEIPETQPQQRTPRVCKRAGGRRVGPPKK